MNDKSVKKIGMIFFAVLGVAAVGGFYKAFLAPAERCHAYFISEVTDKRSKALDLFKVLPKSDQIKVTDQLIADLYHHGNNSVPDLLNYVGNKRLSEALRDDGWKYAEDGLLTIGPSVIPRLGKALDDSGHVFISRERIFKLLYLFGPASREALPSIKRYLVYKNPYTGVVSLNMPKREIEDVIKILRNMGPEAEPTIQLLHELN